MKKEFPNYERRDKKGRPINCMNEIEKVLNPKNKKIIDDFLKYCKINSVSKTAEYQRKRTMCQIYDIMEKPLSSINLNDLRDFLVVVNNSKLAPSTQNDTKAILKRFLIWYYKNWSERFNAFRDIKMKDERNHEKLHPDAMLTEKEIEILVRGANNLKYKALIVLAFESGARPEEMVKLKWSDISFENERVKLYSIKTKRSRSNEIKESIIHLKRYQQEYPFPDVNDNDFVFPATGDRSRYMSVSSFGMYIAHLAKRIGLRKRVWPYLLRHTRLTPLLQILSAKAYEQFSGHALETGMYYYGHLSQTQLSAEILQKVYHVDEVKADRDRLEEEIDNLKKTIEEQGFRFDREINSLKGFIVNANDDEKDLFIVSQTQSSKGTVSL